MRDLTVKDVFTVTRILSKMKLPENTEDARSVGLGIFQSMLGQAEDDIKAWFADLMGVSKQEFECMPAGTVLDVIDELLQRKDIKDFFDRVSRMLSGSTLTSSSPATAGPTTKSSS